MVHFSAGQSLRLAPSSNFAWIKSSPDVPLRKAFVSGNIKKLTGSTISMQYF
jgi:hypothetical protein